MKKTKKVLLILPVVLVIFLILMILNSNLSKQSGILIDDAYKSKGDYDSFPFELSEHDYNIIAAGSTGILEKEKPDDFIWKYNVNHIHTLSWGIGAYSYANDSCKLYYPDETDYAGYNRHIRLEWKWNMKKGRYEVADVYEYITPGVINTFFDMIS